MNNLTSVLSRAVVVAALVASAGGFLAPQAIAQESEREVFEAFAVNMGNIGTGLTGTIQLIINEWTTDAQRQSLIQTLVNEGGQAAFRQLRDMDEVGRIRTPATLGTGVRYAYQGQDEEGRRLITLITDRPIALVESFYRGRTLDYNVTMAQLVVDAEGNGQGFLAVALQIDYDEESRTIELKTYGTEPIRLNNVRKR